MTTRPSNQQMEKLLDFLDKNPGIAKGYTWRTYQARHDTKVKWQELSIELNCMEGAQKDAKGWAKVWTDKKYYLKKCISKHNVSAGGTGGVESLPPLTEMEERMLHILGGPSAALRKRKLPLGLPIKPDEPENPLMGESQSSNEGVDPLSFSPRRSVRRPRGSMKRHFITERERLIRIQKKRDKAELKNAAGWESVGEGLNALATAIMIAGERCENGLEVIANTILEAGVRKAGARNPQPS